MMSETLKQNQTESESTQYYYTDSNRSTISLIRLPSTISGRNENKVRAILSARTNPS